MIVNYFIFLNIFNLSQNIDKFGMAAAAVLARSDVEQVDVDFVNIITSALTDYTWHTLEKLVKKISKVAKGYDLTLDHLQREGINRAKKIVDYKILQLDICIDICNYIDKVVHHRKHYGTDITTGLVRNVNYTMPQSVNNYTPMNIYIINDDKIIVFLKQITEEALHVISLLGPVYLFCHDKFSDSQDEPIIFPDNVIQIIIFGYSISKNISILHLPQYLRGFAYKQGNITNPKAKFSEILPATLEYLESTNPPSDLEFMPVNLKHFTYSAHCNMKLQSSIISFDMLNYGLEKLVLNATFGTCMSVLPPTIKFLSLANIYAPLVNFPASLEKMRVWNILEPIICECGYTSPYDSFYYKKSSISILPEWQHEKEKVCDGCSRPCIQYCYKPTTEIRFNEGFKHLICNADFIIKVLQFIIHLPDSFTTLTIPSSEFKIIEGCEKRYHEFCITYNSLIESFKERFPHVKVDYFNDYKDKEFYSH